MIATTLGDIADLVGGTVVPGGSAGERDGERDLVVDGPVVIDGREAAPGSLFVALVGEHTDGHLHAPQAAQAGAVAVLGTRATELPTVVVEDPQAALQRLAADVVARVRDDLTVIALTGSQGKTSTKDLLAAVLTEAGATVATHGSYNNELGVPLTMLRVDHDTRYLVLEMGARGRGHIAELTALVAPDVSVVLNVGSAHLGGFGSREAIAEAKSELVAGLAPAGVAVLNADDRAVAAMATLAPGRVLTFGAAESADVRLTELVLDRLSRPAFRLTSGQESVAIAMELVGAHQASNAAAAATAALAVRVPLERSAQALAATRTLSRWRMELHELSDGTVLLNDAYNANPESMRAAIDTLVRIGADDGVRRTVAVLGEMRELGEESEEAHRALGMYAGGQVDQLVVVAQPALHAGAVGVGAQSVLVPDNQAALAWLRASLVEGDAVLIKASNGVRLFEVAVALQEGLAP